MIQSILFKSSVYDVKNAIKWLKARNYSFKNVHKTKNYIRFRQMTHAELIKNRITHYKNDVKDNGDIILVECYN